MRRLFVVAAVAMGVAVADFVLTLWATHACDGGNYCAHERGWPRFGIVVGTAIYWSALATFAVAIVTALALVVRARLRGTRAS